MLELGGLNFIQAVSYDGQKQGLDSKINLQEVSLGNLIHIPSAKTQRESFASFLFMPEWDFCSLNQCSSR